MHCSITSFLLLAMLHARSTIRWAAVAHQDAWQDHQRGPLHKHMQPAECVFFVLHPAQVKCHACVGGTSVREDTRILQGGVHVVVGTPGRVYDMLRRRALRADQIRMFVLDEADEMLSRGFKDQIYDIFQLLPPKLQVGGCIGSIWFWVCKFCLPP